MIDEKMWRWGIIGLMLLYWGAAVWMGLRLPALATPNELLNYEYIAVMRQIRGLPNRGLVDSEVRYTEWHQPPVYFVWAALSGLGVRVERSAVNPPPPIEVEKNPFYTSTARGNLNPAVHMGPETWPLLYISRWAAGLMGLVAMAGLYRVGKMMYGGGLGLVVASVVAFQPNFVHLSGSVNNDMPLTAVSALTLAYAIYLVRRRLDEPASFFWLGLLCAAAILTKANGVFVLALAGGAGLSQLWHYRDGRLMVKSLGAGLAGLLPLWGAWLWLNAVRMKDALGVEGSLPVDRVLALKPWDFVALGPYGGEIWRSVWLDWSAGGVGYGSDLVYGVSLAVLGVGFGLLLWRGRRVLGREWGVVLLGIVAISYLYLAVKTLMVKEAGFLTPEGRWWLPVWPGVAWLWGVGVWGAVPRRWRSVVSGLVAIGPVVGVYWLLGDPFAGVVSAGGAVGVFGRGGRVYGGGVAVVGRGGV
ncbi:MAG TPA: glycosyltransferase family 39 protein [Anaerolineae bacterium]|nr:glycosyltransferase family 39 protein [Anaerolineae bacterium]